MTGTAYRLVYYSRNRMVGAQSDLVRGIETILATSRVNNARVGVTGALMFNSGYFGQVLEGSQAAVENVFERIQQDDRHSEVSLLAFETTATRSFETWSMGFVGNNAADAAAYAGVTRDGLFDPTVMSSTALVDTLRRLAMDEGRRGPGRGPLLAN